MEATANFGGTADWGSSRKELATFRWQPQSTHLRSCRFPL